MKVMKTDLITRREMLSIALASPLLAAVPMIGQGQSKQASGLNLQSFIKAPSAVIPASPVGDDVLKQIAIVRKWSGSVCNTRLINRAKRSVRVKEVVLFEINHDLPRETRLYGEGFQMLSQTAGTLGQPKDLSNYTDAKHYKIPAPTGSRSFYGLMTFTPPNGEHLLLAFTSCRRFSGQFRLRSDSMNSLQIIVDTEGLELKPGESWELEEFTFRSGPERAKLLDELAQRINTNHPPLKFKAPPTGWCSWYCFGPQVTAQQVRDNLDFIAKNAPGLKYIQIDDGYQPAMGDWLETGAAFGGNVQGVLKEIQAQGFEPAIWVAPFIAEEKSHLFQQHPDWFIKGDDGQPLRSDKVTFGGWRRGPWYVLDGTHPEVQKHYENLFSTMRREWGCTYFKLDANFWGAMHGGRFYDPKATRIEAYRRGMQSIVRGAGDSFILGCNHPLWPSLGLIHGSRSSNDIKRSWDRFATTGQQNLSRNWQNGKLWWNDPDAIVLMGELPLNEFQFHASVIYASGGMLLSGDDLTRISPERLAMLRKLIPPTGKAAEFVDDTLRVGIVNLPDAHMICLFNWEDKPQTITVPLPHPSQITDFWSGENLGQHKASLTIKEMPMRSARLLVCTFR